MVSLQDAANIIHSMSPCVLPDMEAEEDEVEEAEGDEPQVCSMVDASGCFIV